MGKNGPRLLSEYKILGTPMSLSNNGHMFLLFIHLSKYCLDECVKNPWVTFKGYLEQVKKFVPVWSGSGSRLLYLHYVWSVKETQSNLFDSTDCPIFLCSPTWSYVNASALGT